MRTSWSGEGALTWRGVSGILALVLLSPGCTSGSEGSCAGQVDCRSESTASECGTLTTYEPRTCESRGFEDCGDGLYRKSCEAAPTSVTCQEDSTDPLLNGCREDVDLAVCESTEPCDRVAVGFSDPDSALRLLIVSSNNGPRWALGRPFEDAATGEKRDWILFRSGDETFVFERRLEPADEELDLASVRMINYSLTAGWFPGERARSSVFHVDEQGEITGTYFEGAEEISEVEVGNVSDPAVFASLVLRPSFDCLSDGSDVAECFDALIRDFGIEVLDALFSWHPLLRNFWTKLKEHYDARLQEATDKLESGSEDLSDLKEDTESDASGTIKVISTQEFTISRAYSLENQVDDALEDVAKLLPEKKMYEWQDPDYNGWTRLNPVFYNNDQGEYLDGSQFDSTETHPSACQIHGACAGPNEIPYNVIGDPVPEPSGDPVVPCPDGATQCAGGSQCFAADLVCENGCCVPGSGGGGTVTGTGLCHGIHLVTCTEYVTEAGCADTSWPLNGPCPSESGGVSAGGKCTGVDIGGHEHNFIEYGAVTSYDAQVCANDGGAWTTAE